MNGQAGVGAGREWKPGDVAVIEYAESGSDVAVRLDPKDWAVAGGTVRDGGRHRIRPLVVIDPEDRKGIEEFRDLVRTALVDQDGNPFNDPELGNAIQAALRALVEPTPFEPTNPAVRVIDKDGDEWARTMHHLSGRWSSLSSISGDLTWGALVDTFGPVKVYPEGVQP